MPKNQSKSGIDSSSDRVQFLRHKVNALFVQLVKLEDNLTAQKLSEFNQVELSLRIEQIERLLATFDATHICLEELDFGEMGSELRENFDLHFVTVKASIQLELNKRRSGTTMCSSTMKPSVQEDTQSIVVMAHPKSRLPELQLPSFSGAYTEWIDFFSMFTTVIDKEAELTDIEKFQHLRSCLKSTALDTIRSLEINDENYHIALELLKKRFNNKRLIFQAHIRKLFGLLKVESTSVDKLRELSDQVNSHMRALQTMGSKEQIADSIIIQVILQKLDSATQTRWEEIAPLNSIPSWDSLSSFLEKRCQTLENVEYALVNKTPSTQVGKNNKTNNSCRKSFVAYNSSSSNCVFCDSANHQIYSCSRFGNLSPTLRLKEAKKLALCINCLKKGHQMHACKSGTCRNCHAKHHTLLHFNNSTSPSLEAIDSPSSSQIVPIPSTSVQQHSLVAKTSTSPSTCETQSLPNVVLLATAVIFVKNRAGTLVPCRALLDSGSQLHFVTTRFANQLQLKKTKCSTAVSGIGENEFATENHIVHLWLQSQYSDFAVNIIAAVAATITDNQPSFTIDIASWNIPSNIRLADPLFFKSQRIDLLIVASIFFDLLCVGQIRLNSGLPLLQKSRFGWIVSGGGHHTQKSSAFITSKIKQDTDEHLYSLDDLVHKFWEVENCFEPIVKLTKEELDCEDDFKLNYRRLLTGEYSVRLPMKLSTDLLGDSYQQALRRFENLDRKLLRNPELKSQYSRFIKEYAELNHMSLLDHTTLNNCKYFLPHHCVVKEDSSTTKLRVVFDGSAASSSGFSLNDLLLAGPTIQPKLFNILLRFRLFPVALTGDICKMYRCVRVTPPDNYLQCILWRDSPEEDIKVFKLDTVTYGTKSASFLAVRAMHQLALDEKSSYPLGLKIVLRDFYVDDMITGAESAQEALEIMNQTKALLGKGHFKLRKWCTNDMTVLSKIPAADREQFMKFDDGSNITKALGLSWDPASDNFLFSFIPQQHSNKSSKRSVLSTIARFYDPLGLIGPVLTKSKIFLQNLWREKLDWDESLPLALQSSWIGLCNDFHTVRHSIFPRFVLLTHAFLEIHAFCDASLDAYGACVYVKSCKDNEVQVNLLCSKSRVSPLKSLTVPKLELCAAALLAQLVRSIVEMNVFSCEFHCWSDSSVVLSWLRDEPSKFNIFVSNRITSIQQQTSQMEWHYVPTAKNPADILSKGASPSELLQSSLWLHGPTFLRGDRCDWPESCLPIKSLPEVRKRALIANAPKIDPTLSFKYINSFATMQRIFGYVYKFIARKKSGFLTPTDLQRGTHLLIRAVQMSSMRTEYKVLESNQNIRSSSSISSLSPFLDNYGLLRVGGRLKNSTLDFDSRHPIILPKRHPLTDAIIRHFHERFLHAGPQSLLASIRLQYWPLGGRKTVGSVVNKCIRCFRARPKLVEHIMGDLPKERVQATRAFVTTGIDYCGPFFYQAEVRNRQPIKCYVSLFICFATKAVHLELVKDLSTNAFLAALKRFISIRGKPTTIWSDNATNFVGARNELADLKKLFLSDAHQEAVHQQCLNDGINWAFIPPRSPHFGGLWEASIKTAKFHFYRSIGCSLLNFDELRTLVCQISAIINSRPLFSLSENPDDLEVLTPAHFLIGAPYTAFIEPDVTALSINRLDRWQRVTYLQQLFWKKWRTEYLTLLQQRHKWRSPSPNLSVGAMVLIKDENLPPLKWPLARVQDVIPGNDGHVRVAVLRTSSGTTKRAVNKLCLLPSNDSLESCTLSTGGECLEQQPKKSPT